jgi:hypothetical protein
MAGRVGNNKFSLFGLEVLVGYINSNTLFAFSFKAIG